MARPLRLEYPGAVYHLMARGHERSSLFRDEEDREKFLTLLGSIARDEKRKRVSLGLWAYYKWRSRFAWRKVVRSDGCDVLGMSRRR